MKTRMTHTAYFQGVANAMVCAVGVFGTWLTIGWFVSVATGKTITDSGTIAFAIIWVACLLALVGGWLHGLSRRGSLNTRLTQETYARIDELVRIGRAAVAKAQDESRRLGVPNVYALNGRLYYETATGELSLSDPYTGGNKGTEIG